jgi:hypothetical protein
LDLAAERGKNIRQQFCWVYHRLSINEDVKVWTSISQHCKYTLKDENSPSAENSRVVGRGMRRRALALDEEREVGGLTRGVDNFRLKWLQTEAVDRLQDGVMGSYWKLYD